MPPRGEEPAASTFAEICAGALDTSWVDVDGPATFTAAETAYAALADVVAARDPEVADAPVFYVAPQAEDPSTEDSSAEDSSAASEPES